MDQAGLKKVINVCFPFVSSGVRSGNHELPEEGTDRLFNAEVIIIIIIKGN